MDEKSYLDDLPQRDAAHDIEKAAINAFENAITEAGLFVVQQRNDTNDYGTDIQIEARIGASMTNFRVHVQPIEAGIRLHCLAKSTITCRKYKKIYSF